MIPDRISSTFQTAAQGLAVQRERIAVASRNIANAQTSAPADSPNVYKPQTVKTIGPGQKKFIDILGDSISSLKMTSDKHINLRDPLGREKQAGLGPDFEVVEKESFRYEFDPTHPDADENGMVRYPDVDLVREMAEMVSANRLYEANLSSIEAEKAILKRSMEI